MTVKTKNPQPETARLTQIILRTQNHITPKIKITLIINFALNRASHRERNVC